MPGNLYFGCGRAAEEAPLWRAMLRRPTTRIVYWPFALPPELLSSADNWLRGNLDSLGASYELDTWQSLAHHDPSELTVRAVDLLFVGGGNTFLLLEMVQRHEFLEPVRGFWQSGGDYYGGSAGAILACESIGIAAGHDLNEPGLDNLTGLGLIAGVAILPHYTEPQLAEASKWAVDNECVVLGLPESVGLRCNEGSATAIGEGHVSRITAKAVELLPVGESFAISTRVG